MHTNLLACLCSAPFLNSYTVQNPCLGSGAAPSGLDLPTSLNLTKTIPYRHAHMLTQCRQFLTETLPRWLTITLPFPPPLNFSCSIWTHPIFSGPIAAAGLSHPVAVMVSLILVWRSQDFLGYRYFLLQAPWKKSCPISKSDTYENC